MSTKMIRRLFKKCVSLMLAIALLTGAFAVPGLGIDVFASQDTASGAASHANESQFVVTGDEPCMPFFSDNQLTVIDDVLANQYVLGLQGFENVNLTSSAPVEVIVEMFSLPGDVAVAVDQAIAARSGFMPFSMTSAEEYEAIAEADRQTFVSEFTSMMGGGGFVPFGASASNFKIWYDFTLAFNGFAITLPANKVESLLDITGVKAVYLNSNMVLPDTETFSVANALALQEAEALAGIAPASGLVISPEFEAMRNTPTAESFFGNTGTRNMAYGHPWYGVYGNADFLVAMGIDLLHEAGYRGRGVIIGNIDSGMDYHHPDLLPAFLTFVPEPRVENARFPRGQTITFTHPDTHVFPGTHTIFAGWNFMGGEQAFNPSNDPIPSGGAQPHHGTACGSVVVARGTNTQASGQWVDGIGRVLPMLGIAPEANVIAYNSLNSTIAGLMISMERAAADGVDIITMSLNLGQNGPQDHIFTVSINYIVLTYDIIVATPMGNAGPLRRTLGTSAAPTLALAVGGNRVGAVSMNTDITTPLGHVFNTEVRLDNGTDHFLPHDTLPGVLTYVSPRLRGAQNTDGTYEFIIIPTAGSPNQNVPGMGAVADYAAVGAANLAGRIAVVFRGPGAGRDNAVNTDSILAERLRAEQAGAAGVLLINGMPEYPRNPFNFTHTDNYLHTATFYNAFAMVMSYEDGPAFVSQFGSDGILKAHFTNYEIINGWCLYYVTSKGPTLDFNFIRPDIMAPGVHVYHLYNGFPGDPGPNSDHTNSYGRSNGTSMATPIIAGIATLMLGQRLEETGGRAAFINYLANGGPGILDLSERIDITSVEIKARLMNTAEFDWYQTQMARLGVTSSQGPFSVHEIGAGNPVPLRAMQAQTWVTVEHDVVFTVEEYLQDAIEPGGGISGIVRHPVPVQVPAFNFANMSAGGLSIPLEATITNTANTAKTFTVTEIWNSAGFDVMVRPAGVNLEFSSRTVTVPANGTVSFDAWIDFSNAFDAPLGTYEGYVILTSGSESLSLPFTVTLTGRYQAGFFSESFLTNPIISTAPGIWHISPLVHPDINSTTADAVIRFGRNPNPGEQLVVYVSAFNAAFNRADDQLPNNVLGLAGSPIPVDNLAGIIHHNFTAIFRGRYTNPVNTGNLNVLFENYTYLDHGRYTLSIALKDSTGQLLEVVHHDVWIDNVGTQMETFAIGGFYPMTWIRFSNPILEQTWAAGLTPDAERFFHGRNPRFMFLNPNSGVDFFLVRNDNYVPIPVVLPPALQGHQFPRNHSHPSAFNRWNADPDGLMPGTPFAFSSNTLFRPGELPPVATDEYTFSVVTAYLPRAGFTDRAEWYWHPTQISNVFDVPTQMAETANAGYVAYVGANIQRFAFIYDTVSAEGAGSNQAMVDVSICIAAHDDRTLMVGETLPLFPVRNDYARMLGPVVYTTNNAAVATVSENGVVTAVGEGTAVITATSRNRHVTAHAGSDTITVTVVPAVANTVNLSPGVNFDEIGYVQFGAMQHPTAILANADARNLNFNEVGSVNAWEANVEPILWRVMGEEATASGTDGYITLMSQHILDTARFDADRISNLYGGSSLQQMLNAQFLNNFSSAELSSIPSFDVVTNTFANPTYTGNFQPILSQTVSGQRVYIPWSRHLPSASVFWSASGSDNAANRLLDGTAATFRNGTALSYNLRTPALAPGAKVDYVNAFGQLDISDNTFTYRGVRPLTKLNPYDILFAEEIGASGVYRLTVLGVGNGATVGTLDVAYNYDSHNFNITSLTASPAAGGADLIAFKVVCEDGELMMFDTLPLTATNLHIDVSDFETGDYTLFIWLQRNNALYSNEAGTVEIITIEIERSDDPPIITTNPVLPGGRPNEFYTVTLEAIGGELPLVWELLNTPSSNFPASLNFDPATRTIYGTPLAIGEYEFYIQVTDSASPAEFHRVRFSLAIAQAPVITTASLPSAIINTAYTATTLTATGAGPFTWAIVGGALPVGLILAANGVISGTPTVLGAAHFTVQVTDTAGETDTRTLSILVSTAPAVTFTVGDIVYIGTYPQTRIGQVGVVSTPDGVLGEDYWIIHNHKAINGAAPAPGPNTIVPSGPQYYYAIEPLAWRVLAVDGTQLTLVTEHIIESGMSIRIGDGINDNHWGISRLRDWLNDFGTIAAHYNIGRPGSFIGTAFSGTEYAAIPPVNNPLLWIHGNPAFNATNVSNGIIQRSNDRIFLLSVAETGMRFGDGINNASVTSPANHNLMNDFVDLFISLGYHHDLFADANDRIAFTTDYARDFANMASNDGATGDQWMLRDGADWHGASGVTSAGAGMSINADLGNNFRRGVRPAMRIDITDVVHASPVMALPTSPLDTQAALAPAVSPAPRTPDQIGYRVIPSRSNVSLWFAGEVAPGVPWALTNIQHNGTPLNPAESLNVAPDEVVSLTGQSNVAGVYIFHVIRDASNNIVSATYMGDSGLNPNTPALVTAVGGNTPFTLVAPTAPGVYTIEAWIMEDNNFNSNRASAIVQIGMLSVGAVPPTVLTVSPTGTAVAVSTANIVITFNEPMDTAVVGTVYVNSTPATGVRTWSVDGRTVTIPFPAALTAGAPYVVEIDDFANAGGTSMAAMYSHLFTTAGYFPVTFSAAGALTGGTVTATVNGAPITDGALVQQGSTVVITVTTNQGYAVSTVTDNGIPVNLVGGITHTIVNIAEAHNVVVTFIAPTFTVTINEGSLLSVGPFNQGDLVDIEADPAPTGFEFAGWQVLGTNVPAIVFDDINALITFFTMPARNVTITATFRPTSYDVEVIGGELFGGGTTGTFSQGSFVTIVADTPAPGMRFVEWLINNGTPAFIDITAPQATFQMGIGDVEVEAVFAPIVHNLIINGGTFTGSPNFGQTITISAALPAGFIFNGWTVVSGGVTLASPVMSTTTFTMPNDNVEITANFTAIPYSVAVTGGTATIGSNTFFVANAGQVVTLTADAPAFGWGFSHWDVTLGTAVLDNPANSTAIFVMPAENVAVTAVFVLLPLDVIVTGGTASVPGGVFTAGSTVTVTANTPPTGMEFSEWVWVVNNTSVTLADSTAVTTTFIMPSEHVSLMAVFVPQQYVVTVIGGTASTASGEFTWTEVVTVTANVPAGHQFVRWTTTDFGVSFQPNADTNPATFILPNRNVTIEAEFELITHSVTVVSGTVNGLPSAAFAPGATVTVVAGPPPAGQMFDGWIVLGAGSVTFADPAQTTTTFTMPNAPIFVQATFVPLPAGQYLITVHTEGNGTASASHVSALPGTNVTITATPAAGHVLVNWRLDSANITIPTATTNPADFTMPAGNVVVTAIFGAAPQVAPSFTTQPLPQSLNPGQSATFTVVAAGSPTPTVQWQVSIDNGVSWSNMPGETGTTLTVNNVTLGMDGNLYRAVASNSVAANIPSNTALLTVTLAPVPPTVTSPQNQEVNVGGTAIFNVVASGVAPIEIQWQTFVGGSWVDMPVTGAALTLANVTLDMHGNQYRVVVTDAAGAGSTTSAAATLSVIQPVVPVAPTITQQPSSVTVTAGVNVSLFATASGTAPLSFQWYNFAGGLWVPVPGATTNLLTLSNVTTAMSGSQYRLVVTNIVGSAISNTVTLTVLTGQQPPQPPHQPPQQPVATPTPQPSPQPIIIPQYRTTVTIANAVAAANAQGTDLVVVFGLEDRDVDVYIGAHISANDWATILELEGTIILQGSIFSVYMTNEQLAEWDVEGARIVTILLHHDSEDAASLDVVTELMGQEAAAHILGQSPINNILLRLLHNFNVWLDGDEIGSPTPSTLPVNLSTFNLTPEQLIRLTGFVFDEATQSYVLLPGVLSEDGRTFTFEFDGRGTIGIMVYTVPDIFMRLEIGNLEYSVNRVTLQSDVAPHIANNRTMVPLRIVTEALGGYPRWDGANRVVYLYFDDVTLRLPVGEELPHGLGTPVMLNSRVFVPLRYVSEMIGAGVFWDASNRAVYVFRR